MRVLHPLINFFFLTMCTQFWKINLFKGTDVEIMLSFGAQYFKNLETLIISNYSKLIN